MRLVGSATLIVLATLLGLTGATMVGIPAGRSTVFTPGTPRGTAEVPHNPPGTCPLTLPTALPFVPPSPYLAKPPDQDHFWFGRKKLWTMLPADGTWRGLQPYSPVVPGYRQKVFWWRGGYHWRADPTPPLTVRGRRLDGVAPPLSVRNATNGYTETWKSFMVVGVDFPTHGCWEITGQFEDDELTFVVRVAP